MKWNLLKIFQKTKQKCQKQSFYPEDEMPKAPIFLFILKNQKSFIFSFFLFFFLFMIFYPPRFWSRLFLNFWIIILLIRQTPEWNPLIPILRSTDLFFDYPEAKFTLQKITWGTIYIFYLFHFRLG